MRSTLPIVSAALLLLALIGAVKPDQFTAIWDLPSAPGGHYEFRWKHFGSAEWLALPDQPGTATSFTATFAPVPNEPATDRWMCVDARAVSFMGVPGAWLSETPTGPACNVFEAAVVVVPPPPAPIPVPTPPPVPPAPSQIFTNVQQADGKMSMDYQVGACPRGVQQAIGALKNGSRTITLICRR